MKHRSANNSALISGGLRIGQVTREMVHVRTREIALDAGRAPSAVKQTDYEQAKRELTGESDLDRQDAILDALPDVKRWDPIPRAVGWQAPDSPSAEHKVRQAAKVVGKSR